MATSYVPPGWSRSRPSNSLSLTFAKSKCPAPRGIFFRILARTTIVATAGDENDASPVIASLIFRASGEKSEPHYRAGRGGPSTAAPGVGRGTSGTAVPGAGRGTSGTGEPGLGVGTWTFSVPGVGPGTEELLVGGGAPVPSRGLGGDESFAATDCVVPPPDDEKPGCPDVTGVTPTGTRAGAALAGPSTEIPAEL